MSHLRPNVHFYLRITVGIMLWMYEPLFSTGKYVVMESGFFVSCVIFSLEKNYCMTAN